MRNGAHPRSRGEHAAKDGLISRAEGSSPLARGTRCTNNEISHFLGLIPARAGNTPCNKTGNPPNWAHPRSRGEHDSGEVQAFAGQGSSPLARGTLEQSTANTPHLGLIPARAGNTYHTRHLVCRSGAHPRSRGEHLIGIGGGGYVVGSSPLARGTPGIGEAGHVAWGLIPARAGNTCYSLKQRLKHGAHPRSRGEHRRCSFASLRASGSSPLARGTHLLTWGFTPYTGKIESL